MSKMNGQCHSWYARYIDAAWTNKEGWELLVENCHGRTVWVKAETAKYEDPVGLYNAVFALGLFRYDDYWHWVEGDIPELHPRFYWEDGVKSQEESASLPEVTCSDATIKLEDTSDEEYVPSAIQSMPMITT